MQLNAYVTYDGSCVEAFDYYAKQLGGTVDFKMTYADSPHAEMVPPEWRNKVMHASMTIGGRMLMGCDAPPDRYSKPTGFSLSLHIDSPEEAERVFAALSEQGSVEMPMEETFWALRFGMCSDRFGIPWMVNCPRPDFMP